MKIVDVLSYSLLLFLISSFAGAAPPRTPYTNDTIDRRKWPLIESVALALSPWKRIPLSELPGVSKFCYLLRLCLYVCQPEPAMNYDDCIAFQLDENKKVISLNTWRYTGRSPMLKLLTYQLSGLNGITGRWLTGPWQHIELAVSGISLSRIMEAANMQTA
jgi:hypothetical protein